MTPGLYCPGCETSFDASEATHGTHCPRDGSRLVRLAAPDDPLIGRQLDGRYTIIERIAQGGMGVVYRARQHSVAREVAIKVVHANLVSDAEVIKRFLREAKLASQLGHPSSVAVLDFGQAPDGVFYLVMEMLEGRTLDEVFLEDGVFDARRLVRVGIQICEALAAAQAMAIVHRDLKPSNIILLDNTRDLVKVLDFGLAKSIEGDGLQTTHAGGLCGTPAFIAPERACGRPCDTRSDLYSLGCILYLLGSGRLPFSSASVPELLRMQVIEPAPPMSGVPLALAEVIDRLLAKDPADRFQTAAELRDALEAAVPITGELPRIERPARAASGPAEGETVDSLPALPPVVPPIAAPHEVARRASSNHGVVGARPPTATGMHELVRCETMPSTPARRGPSRLPIAPARRRRWWIAAALACAVGGAVAASRSSEPAAASTSARIPRAAAPMPIEPAAAVVVPVPGKVPARARPVAPIRAKAGARRAKPKLPF